MSASATASEPRASTLTRIRHHKATPIAATLAGVAAVIAALVPIVTHFGGGEKRAEGANAEGESPPPKPPGPLTVKVTELAAAQKETAGEIVAIKVEQAKVGVRLDDLKAAVDRANVDRREDINAMTGAVRDLAAEVHRRGR